jgi:hypothetical protein
MSVPYLFATATGPLPLSQLDADFAYFSDKITVSGGGVAVNGTISPVQATTAAAPAYVKGAMYFDTTLNKMRIGGASGWETVTSV